MTSKHFSFLTFLISGSVFKLTPQAHVGTELEEDEGQLSLLGDQDKQAEPLRALFFYGREGFPGTSFTTFASLGSNTAEEGTIMVCWMKQSIKLF